jgi:hypothetical protein
MVVEGSICSIFKTATQLPDVGAAMTAPREKVDQHVRMSISMNPDMA